MSANNQLLIKKYKGKWYLFNCMAESWSYKGKDNVLFTNEAIGVYKTKSKALNKAVKILKSGIPIIEYGVWEDVLAKDGAGVKIMERKKLKVK